MLCSCTVMPCAPFLESYFTFQAHLNTTSEPCARDDKMLGKELLSGFWVRPECHSYCCPFHLCSCLTSCFTSMCHHSRCDPALSVFASKCTGEKLCLNGCTFWSLGFWLGGSWVSAMCFVASLTLLYGHLFVSCLLFGLFLFWMAIVEDGTKVVIAINILERIAVP